MLLGLYLWGVGSGFAIGIAAGGILAIGAVLYFTRRPVEMEWDELPAMLATEEHGVARRNGRAK